MTNEPHSHQLPKTWLHLQDIEFIRSHPGSASDPAWTRIRIACKRWVTRYRSQLAAQDIDDIVDSAIVENLDALLSPSIPPAEVSTLLARSLNTNRASLIRQTRRFTDEQQIQRVEDSYGDPGKKLLDTDYLAALARVMKQATSVALEALPDRYYRLIGHAYSLPLSPRLSSPATLDSTSQQNRSALYRARRKFMAKLEEVLQGYVRFAHPEMRDVARTALKIVRSGNLQELYYFTYRQEEPARGPVTGSEVGPPAIALVWEPEVLTEEDYGEIVAALGDLVRSEGGIGIQLIDNEGIEVAVPAEVTA